MGLKKLFITLILSLVLLPVTPALAEEAAVSDISKQLICQCGCTLVLSECACALPNGAKAMTALIEQKLAQGQSEEQIIQSFVAQYGEKLLTSPPKKGSNPVVWVIPLGVVLGGGVIYFTLKKRVRRGRQSQTKVRRE